jgi:hypothetical protein
MKFKGQLCAITALLAGCTSGRLKTKQAEKVDSIKTVTIELKIKPDARFDTHYFSNSFIRNYSDQQLVREKHEAVDFTTLTTGVDYNSNLKLLRYKMRTTAKDGQVDLHELAFPEKNEEIEYVVRGNGKVIKAGPYAPDSLFFVPALPVPDHPVEVGDTWEMVHEWRSAREKIPLRLETVGVLKNIVKCEGDKVCADIEISGGVKLAIKPNAVGARFNSRIWGRMLFSLERGDVIWSEVRSEEEMGSGNDRVLIQSCMLSETKLGSSYKTDLNCEPGEVAVKSVPKL